MNDKFDFFFLDGFDWCDLLDYLKIPHYSNEHRGDTQPRSFAVRTVPLPCLEEEDSEFTPEQLLVTWEGVTPPTDEQIQEKHRIDGFD